MSTDRIKAAITWCEASAEAGGAFYGREDQTQGDYEALVEQDQSARLEYARALIEHGWSVPHGLLYDLAVERLPEGYEG